MISGARHSNRLAQVFSAVGHLYVHLFTAIYFVIAVSMERSGWNDLTHADLLELWTLGALLVGLAALPAGWIADRWSAPGMMAVYFLGMGGASIACGFIEAPLAMMLGLAGIGLFAAIYHPVGIAWLVRNAERRGKALGMNGIFGGIGVATQGLLAGALIDLFSWRAAFIVPGVICVLTGLVLAYCIATGRVGDGEALEDGKAPPSKGDMLRAFGILLCTMFLMGMIFQATQAALPKVFDLRLRDLVGEGAFGIGATVALVYGAGSLIQLGGGYLADRYPLKPIYILGFFVQTGFLTLIAYMGGLPLVASAFVSVILSTAVLPAENMLLARYTPAKHRSLAFGLKFVLAFGAAPVAIKLAAETQRETGEYELLFLLLAAMALAATLMALLLPKERTEEQAAPQAAE